MNRRALPPFTSEMTKRERVMALAYIPVHAVLLARCYERTNSIWSSIFFHMTVNAISLQALSMLQELV